MAWKESLQFGPEGCQIGLLDLDQFGRRLHVDSIPANTGFQLAARLPGIVGFELPVKR